MISYKIFKENLKNISKLSEIISDNWHLKLLQQQQLINNNNNNNDDDDDDNKIYYLEKLEHIYLESNLYTFIYQIFYSFSYQVPVFYLNAYESNGKLLKIERIFDLLKLDLLKIVDENDDDYYLDMFTITEHPYLHKPYYYIHPCKTSKWMSETCLEENLSKNVNYTLKWLSFLFSQLNIKIDLQYSKHMFCSS
jgi:hypothetical protein